MTKDDLLKALRGGEYDAIVLTSEHGCYQVASVWVKPGSSLKIIAYNVDDPPYPYKVGDLRDTTSEEIRDAIHAFYVLSEETE